MYVYIYSVSVPCDGRASRYQRGGLRLSFGMPSTEIGSLGNPSLWCLFRDVSR